MKRICKKYGIWMTLLTLLASWSGLAWADPKGQTTKSPDRAAGASVEVKSTSPPSVGKDGPGIKGFAISLDQADKDQNLYLKTAVLVKPLRTDHFFVAFSASAPLMNTNESSTAGAYLPDHSVDIPQGLQSFHIASEPGTVSDWLVMTDWPQANRLLPVDREMHFNSMQGSGGNTKWLSKMELIFLPADQWTVRAILSMAEDDPEYRQLSSSSDAHSARIGMTIDVDYQIFKSIALGFDYEHYRYGRTFKSATGDADASPDHDGAKQSDSFTARLTIRF